MNTLIEPKTVSNSFNIKSKQKIIKTFKKVDKSNKKRKDIYINEEKIEQIKEENKKYK